MISTTMLLLGAAMNPIILPPFTFAGRITDYAHCAYDEDLKVEIRAKTADGTLVAKTTTATGGRTPTTMRSTFPWRPIRLPDMSRPVRSSPSSSPIRTATSTSGW